MSASKEIHPLFPNSSLNLEEEEDDTPARPRLRSRAAPEEPAEVADAVAVAVLEAASPWAADDDDVAAVIVAAARRDGGGRSNADGSGGRLNNAAAVVVAETTSIDVEKEEESAASTATSLNKELGIESSKDGMTTGFGTLLP